MQCALFVRQYARSILAALFLLASASATAATDSYNGTTLTAPTITVGSMTLSNVVLVPDMIITPPSGSSGNQPVDTYDPLTGHLTIPNVTVGSNTVHNAVITVKSVSSIGGVAGADEYNAPDLSIASVVVGAETFRNVIVTVTAANIKSVGSGMPNSVNDSYSGGILSIAAVSVGGHVFTNVDVTVASLVSVGGIDVPSVLNDTQAQATTILAAAHLVVGTVSQATSATVPSGEIISQSPAAGADAPLGSGVNITVSTGSSGGGGGTGTGIGWATFTAAPLNANGMTGLFVVPADPLKATAANISWVLPDETVTAVGVSFVFNTGAQGVGFWPYEVFYAALDSHNVVQIFAVNVTNASATPPTATPVGNFGSTENLTALGSVCDTNSSETNALQPTTWFIVIHIAGSQGCSGTSTATGDKWVKVTTAGTTTLDITTTDFQDFFNANGALTGIVQHDPATNNLYWYADSTFTHPTTLINSTLDNNLLTISATSGGTFQAVGTTHFRQEGSSTSSSLYRMDYTGPASFQAVPNLALGQYDFLTTGNLFTGNTNDNMNIYFVDSNVNPTINAMSLYQVPIGSAGSAPGAAVKLYTAPNSPGFSVLGSNDSVVALETIVQGAPSTSTLSTVPVGVANTATATQIATFTGAIDTTQMLSGSATNFAHSGIYVNLTCPIAKCAPKTQPDSTEILTPTGSVLEALTPDSVFLPALGFLGTYVLEVKGVTDTTGTEGGAMLYDVPAYDNASSYLGLAYSTCTSFSGGSCAAQGPYVIPSGYSLPDVEGVTTNIGLGILEQLHGGVANVVYNGVIANINTQEIGIISIPNTNVIPSL